MDKKTRMDDMTLTIRYQLIDMSLTTCSYNSPSILKWSRNWISMNSKFVVQMAIIDNIIFTVYTLHHVLGWLK